MSDNNDKCVFICCGGKCGSLTLLETLKKYFNTFYSHNFFDFESNNMSKIVEKNRYLCKDIYIIDSYRTPIERKISSFFQNLKNYIPNYMNKPINELIDIFNNIFLQNLEVNHPINDVFKFYKLNNFAEFDFDKKYNEKIYENIHIIKLRFQDINEWETILSAILKKTILITPENLTKNKEYYDLYKEFLSKYKVPKSYLNNELQNDKEFKIYNTIEEQNDYYKKWYEKSTEIVNYEIIDIYYDNVIRECNFNWEEYYDMNKDLQFMGKDRHKLTNHYILHGKFENRVCSK
jgi:hypothetical protein